MNGETPQPYVKSVITSQGGIEQELTVTIPWDALTHDGQYRFSKFFNWWITSGLVAEMNEVQVKTLVVIAYFCGKDNQNPICEESRETLCRAAGIAQGEQVSRAARHLAKKGLISIIPGKRNRPPRYQLATPYMTPESSKSKMHDSGVMQKPTCMTLESCKSKPKKPQTRTNKRLTDLPDSPRQLRDKIDRPIGHNRDLKPIGTDARSITAVAKLIGVDNPIVRYILHHKIEHVWNAYLNTRYLQEVCEIRIDNPAGYFLGQLRKLDDGVRKRVDLDERIRRDPRFHEWNAELKESFLAEKYSR